MKKTIILSALALCMSAISAQEIGSLQEVRQVVKPGILNVNQAAEDPSQVYVKLNVKYPDDFVFKQCVFFQTNNPYIRYALEPRSIITFRYNEGIYYFCLRGEMNGQDYIYISEDIEAFDTMEVTFDFNDCVNKIDFLSVLPDGNDARIEVNGADGSIVEEGNIENGMYQLLIGRSGSPLLICNEAGHLKIKNINGEEVWEYGGFNLNNVGADYEILLEQTFSTPDHEPIYVEYSINAADVRGEVLLRNDPAQYVRLEADYSNPPAGPYDITDADWYKYTNTYNTWDYWGEGCSASFTTSYPEGNHILVCQNLCDDSNIVPIYGVGKCVADNGGTQAMRRFYPIMSPPFKLEGSKATFMPRHTDYFYTYDTISIPEEGVPSYPNFPIRTNSRFVWEWDFNSGEYPLFGNSTPSLTLATVWNEEYMGSRLYAYYMGRLGELRDCDYPITWVTVEKDGQNVMNGNIYDLIGWSANEMVRPNPSGEYVITLEDDNVIVDDIQGLNSTVVTINASEVDHEPPTLTMLVFRDAEDKIVDRFGTPEEGFIEFTAIDFESGKNDGNFPYLVGKPLESLKVEYSAMGEDNFIELPVEEIPELYFMPEFGHLYRGSLASVTNSSDNGWFKVRFTLIDGAGNSQVQTIEPAFRIASAAGVEKVNADSHLKIDSSEVNAKGRIMVYDSLGRLVRSGENCLSLEGLSGMLIIRGGGSTAKIVL